jgi:hypothetical protein
MRVGDFVTVNRTTQPSGSTVSLRAHERPLECSRSRQTAGQDKSLLISHPFRHNPWSDSRENGGGV